MGFAGAVKSIWRRLGPRALQRPPIGFTLSRFAGEGADRRPFPVLGFTMAHRHISWSDFEDALARAEQALRDRPDGGAAQFSHRGVRIDAHPGYRPPPPDEQPMERAAIIEGFKSAMRHPPA